jgi:hypothetical protein
MWTLSDLVTEAREFLQDEVTPYRFSDARIYRIVNNAFGEAYRLRPDLFVGVSYTIPHYTAADSAELFPLDTQYFPAFVDFVVGTIELADDEFAVDGRATAMLNIFQSRMGGGLQ